MTVRFRLEGGGDPLRSLLVWTTTPWTLPANLLVAARADLGYVGVRGADGGEEILAEAALPRYFPEGTRGPPAVPGKRAAGLPYAPLFPFAGPGQGRYRVVLDDMVDAADGTGFVHIAPSYGPEDQRIGEREGVGRFDPLDSRANFTDEVPIRPREALQGGRSPAPRGARGAGRGRAVEPTSGTPTRSAGDARTPSSTGRSTPGSCGPARSPTPSCGTTRRSTWIPAHLREGRFGNFLGEAKDWALSRNRYWGTPLPIWVCPNRVTSPASGASPSSRPAPAPRCPTGSTRTESPSTPDIGRLPDVREARAAGAVHHRRVVRQWRPPRSPSSTTRSSPARSSRRPRSTSSPRASTRPGAGSTRMLVLSTALFDRPAYRVCVSNGLVLDDSGLKMSKSKGNAVEPIALLDRLGGGRRPLGVPPLDYTEPIRLNEPTMLQAANRTLATLVHATAFYRQNADADGLTAAATAPETSAPLDRWLLSRVDGTREAVTASLESCDPRDGALALRSLIDDLSTWYLRRSRPRFWGEGDAADRRAANDTLSFALGIIAQLIAPFAPYTAEHVAQSVAGARFENAGESVHLSKWPEPLGALGHEARIGDGRSPPRRGGRAGTPSTRRGEIADPARAVRPRRNGVPKAPRPRGGPLARRGAQCRDRRTGQS